MDFEMLHSEFVWIIVENRICPALSIACSRAINKSEAALNLVGLLRNLDIRNVKY